ncbi:hypothetical protein [Allochromatium palmeri]|uniref:Uncharacterized protein n=1 Tax=Allochromatium palmeri TaxID=231048 RepID=A0A6N8EB75_9GAMM|nr:hypothetical protein [Allochromatium palmeri]MTW20149.1 hypothetical protein [Allochromatium palmeri]
MRMTIVAIILLLVGACVGGVMTLAFGWNIGAASGMVVGTQAGVCLAVETARRQGVMDEAELNALVATSIAHIRAEGESVPLQTEIDWVEDAAGCTKLVEQLDQ